MSIQNLFFRLLSSVKPEKSGKVIAGVACFVSFNFVLFCFVPLPAAEMNLKFQCLLCFLCCT